LRPERRCAIFRIKIAKSFARTTTHGEPFLHQPWAGLSERAYKLAYAPQRETKYDSALRRARKLRLRLGRDPTDDEYPDKPPRMRWVTYNRLMDNFMQTPYRPLVSA